MTAPSTEPARRFSTGWLIRISVSLLVLSATLWLLPTEEVWGAVKRLRPSVWIFCLLVFLVGHVVSALKWRLLISEHGEVSVLAALRAHFAGLVANLSLPGAAGGDVVRAGLVIRTSKDKARVAVGSLADRLVDTLSVFTLACAGGVLAVGGSDATAVLGRMAAVLAALVLGGAALVMAATRLPWKGRAAALIEKLKVSFSALAGRWRAVAGCFLLSLAIQAVFVGLNVKLADESGVHAPTAAWFFAWSSSKLLSVLPISLGGLGVREASLAALLSPFGASPARVVAVGLLWQSILVASGLLGGLFLLLLSRSKRGGVEEVDP